MRLELYISDLLYRYQCIIIPDFGAFLTHILPARLSEDTGLWYPPAKHISFNAQLHANDGLLAKYIANTEKTTYENALSAIAKTVKIWQRSIHNKEVLTLEHIGKLWLNENNSTQFQPSESINYLASSFGLSPVTSRAIVRVHQEQYAEIPDIKTPAVLVPEKHKKRPYLNYAATFLVLVAAGTVGYHILKQNQLKHYQTVQQEAQQQVEKTIQQATFFDTDPALLPSITLNLNKEVLRYHVVGGAFRVKANAEKKVSQLLTKGYEARQVGINSYGLYIVSYGSFSKADAALSLLKTVRKNETPEAWLWISQ
ncbi:MAG: SPOR domain-containing protein [Bacteroidota bacterium]